jgi:hypothetical protein
MSITWVLLSDKFWRILYKFVSLCQSTSIENVAITTLIELIFFLGGVYFQNRCLWKQRGAAFNSGHCNQLSGGFSDHLVCQVFCPLNAHVAEVLFAPCLPVSFRSACTIAHTLIAVILITLWTVIHLLSVCTIQLLAIIMITVMGSFYSCYRLVIMWLGI